MIKLEFDQKPSFFFFPFFSSLPTFPFVGVPFLRVSFYQAIYRTRENTPVKGGERNQTWEGSKACEDLYFFVTTQVRTVMPDPNDQHPSIFGSQGAHYACCLGIDEYGNVRLPKSANTPVAEAVPTKHTYIPGKQVLTQVGSAAGFY